MLKHQNWCPSGRWSMFHKYWYKYFYVSIYIKSWVIGFVVFLSNLIHIYVGGVINHISVCFQQFLSTLGCIHYLPHFPPTPLQSGKREMQGSCLASGSTLSTIPARPVLNVCWGEHQSASLGGSPGTASFQTLQRGASWNMPSHFQLPAVSCNSAEPFPYLHLLSPIFMQEFCNVYSIPFPRSQLVTNHTVIMMMCKMIYQCCAKHVCRCLVLPELLLDSHVSLSIFLSFFFLLYVIAIIIKTYKRSLIFPFLSVTCSSIYIVQESLLHFLQLSPGKNTSFIKVWGVAIQKTSNQ